MSRLSQSHSSPISRGEAMSTLPLTSSPRAALRFLGLALVGAALITLGAKIQIPFWPVPMTLHTLVVFALAVVLGPRVGFAAMAAYLAAGAAGLPVFSGSPERGIGIAYLAGPTGGYLAGYLLAMPLAGALAEGRGAVGRFGAMLAGLAVVYGLGVAWLALFVPAGKLLALGVTPFLIGDLLKITLVAVATPRLIEVLARLRGLR